MLRKKMGGLSKPEMVPAFDFLYDDYTPEGLPVRFYIAKGGRGKGATWQIARRLIYKAHTQNSRILCTRSVQNSIAESVHRVLCDQIENLGYSEFFEITANHIRSKVSDSEFLFRGLNDLTVQSVKSMEGVTDVWVAEAEDMGDRSWRVLRPTIRAKGSKFWIDYNPEDERSPTNQLATVKTPRAAIVRHVNFDENPFFPPELEEERQEALFAIENAANEDLREEAQAEYNHVWLGACRKVSKASIFGARYRIEALEPNVGPYKWSGPYDGADWGFSTDPTVRVRCWVRSDIVPIYRKNDKGKQIAHYPSDLYIEYEAFGKGVENNDIGTLFDQIPNARSTKCLADCSRPETISHVKNDGYLIEAAKKWSGSVEDGIAHIKGYRAIIIHPRCKETEKEAKNYKYKVDRLTGEVTTDIVDADNHCWDAVRYALDKVIQHKRGAHLGG